MKYCKRSPKRWRVAEDTLTVARGHWTVSVKNGASSKIFSPQRTASLRDRSCGEDPPDCEFRDSSGNLIGVEVTELVDADAIQRTRRNSLAAPAEWTASSLIDSLSRRLTRKDELSKPPRIVYHENFVLVHTNEPRLYIELADEW